MNEPLTWNTLEDAAEWLQGVTGDKWTPRRVLDAALRFPENPHIKGGASNRATAIEAAIPAGHTFVAYVLNVGEGRKEIERMVHLPDATKRLPAVPLFEMQVTPSVMLQTQVQELLQRGFLLLHYARERCEVVFEDGTPRRHVAIEPPAKITISDLRLTGRDLVALADRVTSAKPLTDTPATTATPAPDELDYSLLATPAELFDAYGRWGLKIEWFDDLNSHKWLADARRKRGQGQRGQVIEPLFCPYAVMTGLVEKVHKKNRVRPDTAWRILEHKFPTVYAAFEDYDPRERTGD